MSADLVLVRHAPTLPEKEVVSAAWILAPGAMEQTAALGQALKRRRLAAPARADDPLAATAGGREPVASAPRGRLGGGDAVTSSIDAVVGSIDAVVSSVEPKALATARTLAGVLMVPLSTGADLEEHHRPKAALLEEAAWRRTMRRFFANPEVLVFGSETALEAGARIRRGVKAALNARPGQRLAVVSHGTVLTLLLAEANELDPFELWSSLQMPEALLVSSEGMRIVERLKLE